MSRLHRSQQPRFPVGIQERTFDLVVHRLQQVEYDGPVALSCDDTKLLASFRPYYDADRGGYYLMGHVGEPFELPDPDAFRSVVNEESLQKATKVNYSQSVSCRSLHSPFISCVCGVCKFPFIGFHPL
jgi:hypothetical protein